MKLTTEGRTGPVFDRPLFSPDVIILFEDLDINSLGIRQELKIALENLSCVRNYGGNHHIIHNCT